MKETYVKLGSDYLFCRSNEISKNRETLLFVHGLGESGLCFQEVFEDKRFQNYNIIVPDMIGYGRSSKSETEDYSFNAHVARLSKLIQLYGVNHLILVGHSMGGDITTLFCRDDKQGIVKKYVNIEGDITQFDLMISKYAIKAYKENRFREWFYNDFMNSKIYESLAGKYRSCRRYYASLYFSHPEAFLSNAKELVKRNTSLEGEYKSEIGRIYRNLTVRRVYCYGTESISNETINFLKYNNLEFRAFSEAFHWPMIDKTEKFYDFLYSFLTS